MTCGKCGKKLQIYENKRLMSKFGCGKSCGKKALSCGTCGKLGIGREVFHRFHRSSTGSFPQICGKLT
jgi:hypothetical protein